MNSTALMAKLATLRAFLERHPSLPHPLNVSATSAVYGSLDPTPQVDVHLSGLDYTGRVVDSISAIIAECGPDGWEIGHNAVDKTVDGVEVTVFLPTRGAEPGLPERLMQLGWVRATEGAI